MRWLRVVSLVLFAIPAQGHPVPGNLFPEPGTVAASPGSEAFGRLLGLLRALSQRWEGIRTPLVPVTGRSLEDTLSATTPERRGEADAWILELARVPVAERGAKIVERIDQRRASPIHEIDLWEPAVLFEAVQTKDRELAARIVEAWLQWAEALGRRDILFFAAGRGVDLARFHLPASAILPVADAWSQLPPGVRSERGRAVMETARAHLLFAQGRNTEAQAAYRKARSLFYSVPDLLGQGHTFQGEAAVFFRLGKIRKALHAYQNARDLFLRAHNSLGLGSTLRGKADVFFQLGKNQEALAAYEEARRHFGEGGSKLGQGNTFQGEADVLFRLGKNQEAFVAYRKARSLFQEIGNPAEQGSSLRGEADVLFQLGETREALLSYRRARDFFHNAGDLIGQGDSLRGEADVLFQLGETREALLSYRKARGFFQEAGDLVGWGNTVKGEADVLFRLGESERALEAYRTARDLFQAGGDGIGLGNTWRGEADVLFLLNGPRKALEDYRKARGFFQDMEDPLGQGNTWLREAQVLLELEQWAQARQAAMEALKSYQIAEATDGQISAFLRKAQAEEGSGDEAAAARSAEEAIRLHATRRIHRITERHRIDTDETISLAYDILVPLHAAREGGQGEALSLAEEARSRVLLDLLASGPGREEQSGDARLLAESERLASELWDLESRMARERDPGLRRDLESERRIRLQSLEWNRYERLASLPDPLPQTRPLKAAEIQRLAQDTGPILLYYAARAEVWGFLLRPDSSEILVHRIALPWDLIGERVRNFTYHMANPILESRAREEARAFWDLLIAPFAGALPVNRPWALVPHGPLHQLPFEALLDPEGKALFERWPVSISPSASTLAQALRRRASDRNHDLFAALASGRGLSLPAQEIEDVAELLGANRATFQPTETQFKTYQEIAGKADFLLLATQGVHVEGSRTETYLEIHATPEVHDSRLTAAEIAAIPLKAELVTLAACDTSHGTALLSDERLDLTRAFLISGAAAVLATRWKVPEDAATSRFLVDFYQAYRHGGPEGKGMRKDEALSEARRRSRQRDDSAQVWAAWVLVGDGR